MDKPMLLDDYLGDEDYELDEISTISGYEMIWCITRLQGSFRVYRGDDGELYVDDPSFALEWESPNGERHSVTVDASRTVKLSPEAFAMLLDRSGMKVLTKELL